ncbi:hypothetical protein GCM10011506_19250 [Marivirga lumbricoides]|uniref:HTH marR-type domain-containing protein n=1 Tax=Marivirga lumbricoides TaxID=1046115 RepID=A0ABQ1M2K9_9BACT|nr:hypothetical protein GCM10011506_19250 [Marivirga lumbricoides]
MQNVLSPKEATIEQTFAGLLKCQHTLCYNIAQKLKKFNLTRQQFEVLSILKEKYPEKLNINAVRSEMNETMPDISRIANRLHEKGYINRLKKEFDKRNTEICLTEEGFIKMELVQPIIYEEMGSHFNKLSDDELLRLNEIIYKVTENNSEKD